MDTKTALALMGGLGVGAYLLLSRPQEDPQLPTGLIHRWPLNEGQNSIAYDSVGTNNGTIMNGAWSSDANRGTVLGFDGTTYISLPQGSLANNNFTLATWFRTNQQGEMVIYSERSSINFYPLIVLEMDGFGTNGAYPGIAKMTLRDDALNLNRYITSNTYDDDQWHHIAFARQGNSYFIYVDGVLDTIEELATTIGTTNVDQFTIGADHLSTGIDMFFVGSINDVTIFNRALSQAEITNLYNITK